MEHAAAVGVGPQGATWGRLLPLEVREPVGDVGDRQGRGRERWLGKGNGWMDEGDGEQE